MISAHVREIMGWLKEAKKLKDGYQFQQALELLSSVDEDSRSSEFYQLMW